MTVEKFAKLLRDAGLALPPEEAEAAFPAAQRLFDLANHLPEAEGDDD